MIRKPNILILLGVLICLSISSCVEEIDPQELGLEDFKSQLVVNGLFDSDSSWEVEISKTTSNYDPDADKDLISFATVEIYDQNNKFLYFLEHDGNGVYKKEDSKPSPKRAYSIKVSAPGFHAVTARGYVPEKSVLQINNYSIIENEEEDQVEVDFEIEDRSELKSYYLWEVVNLNRDDEGGGSSTTSQFSDTWINDLTNNPIDLVKRDREFLGNESFGDGKYQGSYNSSDGNRRVMKETTVGVSTSATLTEDITYIFKMDPSVNNPDKVNDYVNHQDGGDVNIDGGEENKIIHKYELRVMTISKELYDYYSSLEEYYQRGFHNHSDKPPFLKFNKFCT